MAESQDKSSDYAQAPHGFPGVGLQEDHVYRRKPLHVGRQHGSLLGVANNSASDLSTPSAPMNSPANSHLPAISLSYQLPTPPDHAHLSQRLLDVNEHAGPRHDIAWQEPRQDFAVGSLNQPYR